MISIRSRLLAEIVWPIRSYFNDSAVTRAVLDFAFRIAGLPVAYRVESRPTGPRAVGDTIAGEQIVILADRDATPAMYRSRLGSEVVDFEVADGQIVGGGSTWSGEGKALDGPLLGQRLTVVPSHMTRWLQWQSFHPDVEMRRPPAPSR